MSTNPTVSSFGWQVTPDEALAELLRWGHTAQTMAVRVCDPAAGPLTRDGDVRLFALAVRQVLRFAVLTRDLLEEPHRTSAANAIDAFDAKVPAAQLIRDVTDHWGEYLQGIGLHYRGGRAGDYWPETDWLTLTRPTSSWGEWGNGTYLLFISPRPGTVIQLDVRTTAVAVAALSHTIQEVVPEAGPIEGPWFLIGPTGVGKSTLIAHLNQHGIRSAVLDEVLDSWPDDDRDLVSKVTDWELTQGAIARLVRSGVVVIDLGAGTQGLDQWRSLQQPPLPPVVGPWLEQRAAQVINLHDEPKNIWHHRGHATLEGYLAFEFNEYRQRGYAAAGHTIIRTGRTADAVLSEALTILRGSSAGES